MAKELTVVTQDWRSAYFRQAVSDYETFKLLVNHDAPVCQRLHYLQMTTEKLAKGFLTPVGGPRQPTVHNAFVNFVRSTKLDRKLRRVWDCGPSQIKAYVDSLLPIAEAIENLAPAGNRDKPNPEYPWEAQTALGPEIFVPADYHFADLNLQAPKMIKLLKFVDRCFEIIE